MSATATTRQNTTVCIIIPVRDDPRVQACLGALAAQTFDLASVEVVVADNGSSERFASFLDELTPEFTKLKVRVIHQVSGGSYAARNAAVAHTRAPVLAFTDADCIPEADWLSSAVTSLEDGADVVAGRVKVFVRNAARPHPVEAYELVHAFPQHRYVQRGGACVTANLVTTRRVFDDVGPFLDTLRSGADIEWSQRANARAYRTRYVAEAAVAHPARATFGAYNAKLRRVVQGRLERSELTGAPRPTARGSWRGWVPPLGAFRRAYVQPELTSAAAKWALVIGEFYCRYAAAIVAPQVAREWRRRQGRNPGGLERRAR